MERRKIRFLKKENLCVQLLDESNDLGTRVTIEKVVPRRNYPEQRGSTKSVERAFGGLANTNFVNHNQIQIEMEMGRDAFVN